MAKQTNIGFNDTTIINSNDKSTLLAMFDKLTRIADGRRVTPHDQTNNVTYAHRTIVGAYNLQIGDTCFMIPPEFICVTSESTSQQIVTLRQENSMRQKAGSRKRTLLIDLVFNGADQINGYRVEGPESVDEKHYYVDGLRQLLAQFKCTPFLPVQNELLNGTHGIFTVVLQGITISTVPGFPSLMTAQLTLQEVELFPYLEMPNAAFKFMIDWDLFRYYYQRFLTESYEYKKLQSIPVNKNYNRFKISILKESVFTELDGSLEEKYGNKNNALLRQICDNENYDVWVDSDVDDVKINAFQCGYYNILTNMQLSDTSTPTVQFMGGMDTIFNISIETTDVNVVTAIEQCRLYNDTMVRNNAKYRSLGFVKLDSELVAFTGSLFVVIDNVTTATTPEFPGLYQIQIQCVAFDIGQSARENLNGFLPFDDEIARQWYGQDYSGSCARLTEANEEDNVSAGYISDHTHDEQVIEQSMNGLRTKIRQDCYAEWKLRTTMELYPDLYLPTYAEVDAFIAKCNTFRLSKGLDALPYSKYPTRPECMLQGLPLNNDVQMPGNIVLAKDVPRNSEYNGYVDPDFYVFYPFSYQSFGVDCYEYNSTARGPITKDITINTMPFGSDSTSESGNYGMANSSWIDEFISLARKQVGKPYSGEVVNPPTVFACTTLVSWCLTKIGAYPQDVTMSNLLSRKVTVMLKNADGLDDNPQCYRRVPAEDMRRGDLIVTYGDPKDNKVIANGKHVMIFDGTGFGDKNAKVIHAANSKRGVVEDVFWWPPTSEFDVLRVVAFDSIQNNTDASNVPTTLEGRQAMMWDILLSMGYTDAAAAGMIACWTEESGCNFKSIEGLPTFQKTFEGEYGGYAGVINDASLRNEWTKFVVDRTTGVKLENYQAPDGNYYAGMGLCQWTADRGQEFLEFVAQNGGVWDDPETQLQFFQKEMLTKSRFADINKKMMEATDPRQAALDFCLEYEGYYGDNTSRLQLAEELFERFVNGPLPQYIANNAAQYSGNVLTQAEFNAICQTIYGQVDGFRDYQQEATALAQLIYDRLTAGQTTKGLGAILSNKEMFVEDPIAPAPEDIEAIVKSVFCDGVRKWPDYSLIAYLPPNGKAANFSVFGSMFQRLSDVGSLAFWADKPIQASSDVKFTIIESSLTGYASRSNYDVVTSVSYEARQAALDKFAEPVFVKTDAILYNDEMFQGWTKDDTNWQIRKAAKFTLNDGENIFGSSFVDEAQYSCRGRLVRAFPTYLFCVLDDDTQWYAGNKLWTNYYMRKSVVDIQVHETNDMPIATAVLTVANVYSNLSTKQKGLGNYNVANDLNGLFKWWYKATGQVIDIGSPNLTESAIKLKQVIYNNAKIREGSRAHIRMGYGSDPLSLAPMINGTITDVSIGDQLTIVVTSDGVELTQHITSALDKTNNGWLGLFGLGEDQESSNLIANILCKRDSVINYFVSAWYEGSKYGIEHFGLYFNQSAFGTVQAIAEGASVGATVGITTGNPVFALAGAGIGALLAIFATNDINLNDLWDGYAEQYDICKNLYKADYSREHYIYANWGEADGEKNICFNQANMTPWDVMQICTQQVPEYIVKPSYHQFDSRLYFGLPLWMEKYRYDYLGGRVYEECKASTQVHMLESITNIIDNQVKVTNKYNDTNKKVIYVRGDSPASTRVIHSDDSIDYAKQKTGIIDSAIAQDFLGPDALYELISDEAGQGAARRIGISNLLYEWQLQYQGEILCMGLPGVKAHDYILVDDTYTTMAGLAIVREVTHSFGTDTGFTTSITPGLIGFSSDQQSGLHVAAQNYLQLYNGFSSLLMARANIKMNYEKSLKVISELSVLDIKEKNMILGMTEFERKQFNSSVATTVGMAGSTAIAVAYMKKAGVGKEIVTFIKSCIKTGGVGELGDIAKAAVKAFKLTWGEWKALNTSIQAVDNVVNGVRQVSRLTKAISSGASAAISVVFPPWVLIQLALSIIIDILVRELFLWWENRNVCMLLPLWFEGYPFISGVQGQRKLLMDGSGNGNIYGKTDDGDIRDGETYE